MKTSERTPVDKSEIISATYNMISIIICSKTPELLQKVSASIEQTIGVAYEIIAIDNAVGKIGICEAYNRGAAQAKYNYLCFSHEDVIYHTRDWGKNLVAHLEKPEIGVVGICGCTVKPKSPSGAILFFGDVNRTCMLQTGTDGKPFKKFTNPLNEIRSEVKVLDGVFLSCRKEVWAANRFDEKNFANFHGYDIDFSIQVSRSYRNYVIYDVLLEHASEGHNNEAWITSVVNLANKWKDVLPVSTGSISKKELTSIEAKSIHYFIREAMKNKTSFRVLLPYYLQSLKYRPFTIDNLKIIKAYLVN